MTRTEDIWERLREVRPLGADGDIVSLGMVKEVRFEGGAVDIDLDPRGLSPQALKVLLEDAGRAVGSLDGVERMEVNVPQESAAARAPDPFAENAPLPGVRDIVAVSSAKGGVGKSTVAVNLAAALSRLGRKIAVLDADVFGPSLPTMVGLNARPRVVDKTRILPLEKFGLKLMSLGFFLDENTPVIWRGPLVMGLVRQFLKDVDWGEVDVLVVDLPPGTGDTQLTMAQELPVAGAVVVTTPQTVATDDVRRAIRMLEAVNIPIAGVVETMGGAVFGTGGGRALAAEYGLQLLAELPLDAAIREASDAGQPIAAVGTEAQRRPWLELAAKLRERLAAVRAPAPG